MVTFDEMEEIKNQIVDEIVDKINPTIASSCSCCEPKPHHCDDGNQGILQRKSNCRGGWRFCGYFLGKLQPNSFQIWNTLKTKKVESSFLIVCVNPNRAGLLDVAWERGGRG